MQNNKPVFTDEQLKLIEDSITCLRGDEIFDRHGHTPDQLNEVYWLCKFYRIKFRRCEKCNHHTKVKDMDTEKLCKNCSPRCQKCGKRSNGFYTCNKCLGVVSS